MLDISIVSQVHEAFQHYPELLSCAGFLIGVLVGNWIAIGRDKRKEFNDIVTPDRELLTKAAIDPHQAYWSPTPGQIDRIEFYLRPWKRKRFHNSIKLYHEACKEQLMTHADGSRNFRDVEIIKIRINAIQRLLRFR